MDNRPNADERLLEAIEACRPGSDDVADPALAYLAEQLQDDPRLRELYERVQQTDAKIAAAFCDVPVPEGLDRQILDRLAAAKAEMPVAEPAALVKRRPRRWFLGAGIGATVAAAGVILAVVLQPPDTDLTLSEVRRRAIDVFKSDWPNGQWPEEGQAVTDGTLEKFPISRGVAVPARMQWRNVQQLFGAPGVAYDMIDRRGRTATLYVIRRTLPDLPTAPPRAPHPGTAGCVTATWSRNGLLYVLVVRGGERDYESFVPPGYLT